MHVYFTSSFDSDSDDTFVFTNGDETNHFDNVVTYPSPVYTEDFVISDTSGRYIPIHIDNIGDLISALQMIQSAYAELQEVEENICSTVAMVTEGGNEIEVKSVPYSDC